MKKAGKIIIYIALVLIVTIGMLLSYVKFALPNVGEAPGLKVELTPERIERGKYLATHVTVCVDCHSSRDWSKFSGPIDPKSVGSGGEKFDQAAGLPGTIYSANITPHNLKNWTDGELFRAITTGVKKDGSAIFPIMPYASYGKMDKEDIYSIIAFIRTLPEQQTSSPERELDFPLNFIVNTIPAKATPQPIPPVSKPLEFGAYMVNASACFDCHTNVVDGTPIEGMDFAGGREFKLPGGSVFTANITPDKETGIGHWTKQQFVERFKSYADSGHSPKTVNGSEFQTVMPWTMYGGMKTQDLEAIYTYLRSVKPIKNQVTKFVPKG
ncbi:c-type cytochrome [Paradesertivirga mongoliensis]|uniref:C-type cytochrome n=1 Tax=Paradesertivirga mongoliensis TaxID=2100740 RepID=A0ABW4ZN00_9SPHI|nr:cytochrome C [Pedobacter mongoliensis]